MSVTDPFWICLIIIAVQPLFRQKALEFGRRRGLMRLTAPAVEYVRVPRHSKPS